MSRALLIEIEERERIETRLVTELETHKAVSVTIDNKKEITLTQGTQANKSLGNRLQGELEF